MTKATETLVEPLNIPGSLKGVRKNLYNLNLGYLALMKSVGEQDMVLARKVFKGVPGSVLEKIARAPYQVLVDIAQVITVTPVVRTDIPEAAWGMIAGVIDGELSTTDLGSYILSVSLR